MMNYQALIDFNKYTLAVAGGAFIYTIEKFVPMESAVGRWLILALLFLFLISIVAGVLLFAAATSALHATVRKQEQDSPPLAPEPDRTSKFLGILHSATMAAGLFILGVLLAQDVLEPPKTGSPTHCTCTCP